MAKCLLQLDEGHPAAAQNSLSHISYQLGLLSNETSNPWPLQLPSQRCLLQLQFRTNGQLWPCTKHRGLLAFENPLDCIPCRLETFMPWLMASMTSSAMMFVGHDLWLRNNGQSEACCSWRQVIQQLYSTPLECICYDFWIRPLAHGPYKSLCYDGAINRIEVPACFFPVLRKYFHFSNGESGPDLACAPAGPQRSCSSSRTGR